MLRTATTLGLLGALVVAAAGGEPADRPYTPEQRAELFLLSPKQLFKRIDANKDGKISREEFNRFARKAFPGMVRKNPQLPDRMFDRADEDGDGYLDLPEFKAMLARIRERAGQSKDKKGPDR
jgi:Ca2+-binding EF-hand superfamily protein